MAVNENIVEAMKALELRDQGIDPASEGVDPSNHLGLTPQQRQANDIREVIEGNVQVARINFQKWLKEQF